MRHKRSWRQDRKETGRMNQMNKERIPLPENPPVVLLVEDNMLNQKAAMFLLEELGVVAQLATNGKEAVEAISKDKFALILMDCHMPEMDGFEATVAIRKLEELAGSYTPIIAVTALAMAGDRERCIAAGMDDYISKPIDKTMLQVKLDHWLRSDVVYHNQKLRRKLLRPHANIMVLQGAPVNLVELHEFYGPERTSQLLALFAVNTEEMLKQLHQFMSRKQKRLVAGCAHELKASCASIGAKQLGRLALYLEQAIGQEDWIEAEETITSIERCFAVIKDFIKSSAPMKGTPA